MSDECLVNGQVLACGYDKYDEYDARGIYLCKVCLKCVKHKLRGYRPEVLTNPYYTASEPIEPEEL